MKKTLLLFTLLSIHFWSYAQICHHDFKLSYNSNIIQEIGTFKAGFTTSTDEYGGTNRILVIDKDNLGTFNNPTKMCGLPQPNIIYENTCITMSDFDQKFVLRAARENENSSTTAPCFSRDFVYIDIVDTKFSSEVLPNCGGFKIKNTSTPFSPITQSGKINVNEDYDASTKLKSWDFFPITMRGEPLNITYTKSAAELQIYEFFVVNTSNNTAMIYPSKVGHELILPNENYSVELRIKGIIGKLNQVSPLYKITRGKTLVVTACSKYTVNNTVYTKSGTYSYTKKSVSGCDSLITFNLSIIPNSASTINFATCASSYTLNGQSYATSGTFTQTLKNKAGCDSTITLNLKINKPTSSIINQVSCNSSITINGVAYNTGGSYTQTLKNKAGCDSTITINLTFIKINSEVKVTIKDLTALETNAMFKWFDCSTPATILKSSDSPIYGPTSSGTFGVTITKNGCSATSACITFSNPLATEGSYEQQTVTLSPNPTSGTVTLAFEQIEEETTIYLVSSLGQTISRTIIENAPSASIELQNLPSGLYYLLVHAKDKKTQSFTVLKD